MGELFAMAMAAARLLSRRACRIGVPSFSNSAFSLPSSPAVAAADDALVLSQHLSSVSLTNVGLDRGSEAVRLQGLSHLVPFGRVYSTGISEGGSGEQNDDLTHSSEAESKASIKPPPRPFKLNYEQQKLAEEIGYKVVDRLTEKDFGWNKRPKAFAVVQVCAVSSLLAVIRSSDSFPPILFSG